MGIYPAWISEGEATMTNSENEARSTLESITDLVKRLEILQEVSDEDADDVREEIQSSALSVDVRSGWVSVPTFALNDPAEYQILLYWGGPAVRIVGNLSRYRQPETARIEHQGWGTPWTELVHQSHDTLLTFACQFYYGS